MVTLAPTVTIWVIYDSPSDYPGQFVVRKWHNEFPDASCYLFPTLEAARRSLPRGLVRLLPHPTDDPVIVETWL